MSCGRRSLRFTSWSHWSAFFLPTFLTLRPWAGDAAPPFVLQRPRPASYLSAVTTVSSVPRGYCHDVISSWQHHRVSPPSPPDGRCHRFTALGSGGVEPRRDGETVRKTNPPRSAPLHAPAEVIDWGLEKMAQKSLTLLTCQAPSPSLCVTLHRRTNYPTQCADQHDEVHITTNDARFHPRE